MTNQQWQMRFVSFGYSFLGMALVAVLGVLTSPSFSALLTANFGNTLWTSLALLVIPEVVKALRNLQVVKKLGSKETEKFLI